MDTHVGRVLSRLGPFNELGVRLEGLDPKQHFTQPPPRYNEASLVKTLEELGIGRPSTYATTCATILDRKYVEKQGKMLVPTRLGKAVNELVRAKLSGG